MGIGAIMGLFRRREALLALLGLVVFLGVVGFYQGPNVDSVKGLKPSLRFLYSSSQEHVDARPSTSISPSDSLEVLSQLYEDERVAVLADYNQQQTEELVRTPHDALNADFNKYITRLEGFINNYFNHSMYHPRLVQSLQSMVSARPPTTDAEFTKRIFSFDKEGRAGAPDTFDYWDKRMGSNGWVVEVGDDDRMEEWYGECAGAMMAINEEDVPYAGKERWNEMWHGLGRPVLKSDILRYLMSLIQGGLYTDSDTAPLSDINLWGTHANNLMPRGLVALQRAMRHLDSSHPSSKQLAGDLDSDHSDGKLDFASNPIKEVSLGINNPRVALVVSVEYDTHHERQDPRFGYTRDLQIVQWTFMSKPFHPVFMDILETATTTIMARRASGEGHNSWQSILDVTGPGPFTDAVLRYLLVQYGVTANELLSMEGGALIGDVLILPLHAFGSYPGGEEDWNAHDPSTRCTSHGFKGRWKGDINFEKRSGSLRAQPRFA